MQFCDIRDLLSSCAGLMPKGCCLVAMLAFVTSDIAAATIVDAQYVAPTERYGHFALGRPHEYARLQATTSNGQELELQLPDDEVFEDLAPRRVKLAPDEPDELLVIISRRGQGSRLALIRVSGDRLTISAQSAAIGTPMRWLNPVGVADLDGDGRSEIAAVITPHIGGFLKIYRRKDAELIEVAALAGFSNHVYGSTELALSTAVLIEDRMYLLVPDTTRRHLRIVALQSGRLAEAGRCTLAAPITGAIKVVSTVQISVSMLKGEQVIVPRDCLK